MPNRVEWNPRHSVGDESLDAQHRELLARCNALGDCLAAGGPDTDPEADVAVLRGEGRAFCSGADVHQRQLRSEEDMARQGYFSHTSPEGKTPWDWMSEAGVTYSCAAQNIGRGYVGTGSGEGMIEALFEMMIAETPPNDYHRQSILNPAYRSIGVGVARDGAGNLYWVCNFTG